MDVLQAFLLGILQGITEFLPISSSGHLVLARELLESPVMKGITFEVVVHFGTLCSILVYYAPEIRKILNSLFNVVKHPVSFGQAYREDKNFKLILFILWSMIPALIVGLLFEDAIESRMMNATSVGYMLLLTGVLLLLTRWLSAENRTFGWGNTFGVGLAQAMAIVPGISRSGSTISAGLYLGIPRKRVADFSFLMVIPVIAGAMLLKIVEMTETGIEMGAVWILVVGFLSAFISGYYALKYLIKVLQKGGLHWFALYCWALGLVALLVI